MKKENWCECWNWKNYLHLLANHAEMKFCPFCGAKLTKKTKVKV